MEFAYDIMIEQESALIADISETMGLPIKNFVSEQQAIVWLKESE